MPGHEALVVIGHLGAPHGLRGELRFFPESDFPERLVPGRRVAICRVAGDPRWTRISGVRSQNGRDCLVFLEGIASREDADGCSGATLCVGILDLPPLPEGRYYHHQIVGLQVIAADGRSLGRILSVRPTGANDVYVMQRADGGEVLIPAIRDAVAEIDLTAGRLLLKDMPGLLEP